MASRKSRYEEAEEKRGKGQYLSIRAEVFNSEAWAKTSAWGIRLIMDLAAQYNGINNGDLCATWNIMRVRGWKSRATLYKAQQELIKKRWVIITRKGALKIPNLYALTFWGIDECKGKLDPGIIPRNKPRDSWKAGNTPPDIAEERRKKRARKIGITDTPTVP